MYPVTFTVPAGTPVAAPVTVPVILEDAKLISLRIIIPDGHNALTGLRVTWAGTQVVPYGTGTWIIANSEIIDYDWDDEVTANGLALAGYNTDIFDHSFQLRFTVGDLNTRPPVAISSPLAGPQAAPSASLPLEQLTSSTFGPPAEPVLPVTDTDLVPIDGGT